MKSEPIQARLSAAVWELPFRPFFLGGTAFAALLVPLWIAVLLGALPWILPAGVNPLLWHGHEMVFGFGLAIIVGFLGTASQTWSGQRGLHGSRLVLLFSVWLVGRLAFVIPGLSVAWRLALELPWLPLAGWCLFPHLRAAGRRNLVFLALLGVFFVLDLVVHLDMLAIVIGHGRHALYLAVYVIVLMVSLIAGRVVPFFVAKGLGFPDQRRPPAILDGACTLGLVPVAIVATYGPEGLAAATLAFVFAALHLWRLVSWFRPNILRNPMLAILVAAYAWMPVALVLTGLALMGMVVPWLALHAFTAGVMSVMIYGMVSRVSLGHTGRAIRADAWLVGGFVAINAAATARVLVPLLASQFYVAGLISSAILWSGAFGLLFVRLLPLLLRPRPS